MPTKPGLTRMEHEELGAKLKQLRDEALRIALFLENAYAKQSPLCKTLLPSCPDDRPAAECLGSPSVS